MFIPDAWVHVCAGRVAHCKAFLGHSLTRIDKTYVVLHAFCFLQGSPDSVLFESGLITVLDSKASPELQASNGLAQIPVRGLLRPHLGVFFLSARVNGRVVDLAREGVSTRPPAISRVIAKLALIANRQSPIVYALIQINARCCPPPLGLPFFFVDGSKAHPRIWIDLTDYVGEDPGAKDCTAGLVSALCKAHSAGKCPRTRTCWSRLTLCTCMGIWHSSADCTGRARSLSLSLSLSFGMCVCVFLQGHIATSTSRQAPTASMSRPHTPYRPCTRHCQHTCRGRIWNDVFVQKSRCSVGALWEAEGFSFFY